MVWVPCPVLSMSSPSSTYSLIFLCMALSYTIAPEPGSAFKLAFQSTLGSAKKQFLLSAPPHTQC